MGKSKEEPPPPPPPRPSPVLVQIHCIPWKTMDFQIDARLAEYQVCHLAQIIHARHGDPIQNLVLFKGNPSIPENKIPTDSTDTMQAVGSTTFFYDYSPPFDPFKNRPCATQLFSTNLAITLETFENGNPPTINPERLKWSKTEDYSPDEKKRMAKAKADAEEAARLKAEEEAAEKAAKEEKARLAAEAKRAEAAAKAEAKVWRRSPRPPPPTRPSLTLFPCPPRQRQRPRRRRRRQRSRRRRRRRPQRRRGRRCTPCTPFTRRPRLTLEGCARVALLAFAVRRHPWSVRVEAACRADGGISVGSRAPQARLEALAKKDPEAAKRAAEEAAAKKAAEEAEAAKAAAKAEAEKKIASLPKRAKGGAVGAFFGPTTKEHYGFDKLTENDPYTCVPAEKILDEIKDKGKISDMYIFKEKVEKYKGDPKELLFCIDPKEIYGDNGMIACLDDVDKQHFICHIAVGNGIPPEIK